MRLPLLAKRKPSWQQWAVGVWVGFTVAAAVKVLVQPTAHTVYPVFAEGARNWWQDISLYEPTPDLDLFRYSPTFAVLMTPFGLLPDWLGGVLWVGLNVGMLFFVLHWAAGEVFPGLDHPEREAIWLILTLAGSARSLWAGQSNSLILAGAIGAMLAIRRGWWWTAALLLTGGGFIKVWPWALALLAGACWPRRLGLRILVSIVFWSAIPFLTRPPETVLWQYGEWFRMLHSTEIYRWGGYRDAWTIWELIRFPVPKDVYELVQCETALAVLAWCLWQRRQIRPETAEGNPSSVQPDFHSDEQFAAERLALCAQSSSQRFLSGGDSAEGLDRMAMSLLGAWASWQLLFGPGTERLTYILIAPMSSWAVLASFQSGRYRVWAVGAWGLITLFSMGAFERLVLKITPWGTALLPLGAAVFAGWLVLHETLPGPILRNIFSKKQIPSCDPGK